MDNATYYSGSYRETEKIGYDIGKKLTGNEVVALFGGLGMGKTAFIRGLANGLGVPSEHISSPTFAIVHEHMGRVKLFHYDMYRIETWEDLESTGFFDALDNGVLAIEWSENIENALPLPRYEVKISAGDSENERKIVLSYLDLQEGNC